MCVYIHTVYSFINLIANNYILSVCKYQEENMTPGGQGPNMAVVPKIKMKITVERLGILNMAQVPKQE